MKVKTFFCIFCFFFLLSSCQVALFDSERKKDKAFSELYPGIEFNNEIVLDEDPIMINYGFIGSEVNLLLVNNSNNQVSFSISKDVDILFYSKKRNKWIEVINNYTYEDNSVIMYPKGGNNLFDAQVYIWPEIYNTHEPIEIRIVAFGHRLENNDQYIINEQTIGAYYDIELIPFE